ncbi:MAG: hypothetical protein JWQ19_4006 [Subtercola sp.]|nr:hypothetical protein [Subtercola sp.]
MLFNSIPFLYFFIITTTLFFTLPHKLRWILLLIASCVFYMFFKPEYILILAFTIFIDFYAGILMENTDNKKKKRNYLIMSLIANIGILAVFKYYNFINGNITGFVNLFHYQNHIPYLKMLLPIGLSFHTFQAMSYTIEVYRGNYKAERHLGIYALYVMFYPQLVAGPIERPQNILYQFRIKKYFNYDNAVAGLNLMMYGLFKKVVIADRLAVYVNKVYANVDGANSTTLLIAMIFFAIQIYCDFSGYTDIARGAAKFMGYDLLINFKRPFESKNITEFWRKWHISLSTWFNDYLFTPMVINFRELGMFGVSLALFITFFLSGLWHGAGWTFIIYGIMHGIALIYEVLTKKIRKKVAKKVPGWIYNNVSIVLTFLYVSFSWVFFRVETVGKAFHVIKKIFSGNFTFKLAQISGQDGTLTFLLCIALIFFLFVSYKLPVDMKFKKPFSTVVYLTAVTFLILILGCNGTGEFIYFQF